MKNLLFTSILFLSLLLTERAIAQDYIYATATGTSWAYEEYEIQQQLDQDRKQHGYQLTDAPHFQQIFQAIKDDYRLYHSYNDSIFIDAPHNDWISMFDRRAHKYSDIYGANNDRINELKDYFQADDVPDEAYDSLYVGVRDLYHNNINDIYLYELFLDILIPHYEMIDDFDHLIFCYCCAGFFLYQSSRMGQIADALRSVSFYQKVLSYRNYFAAFSDPLNRYYLISALVNLTIMQMQEHYVSLEDSYDLISDMQEIYDNEETKSIFAQDQNLQGFAVWSIDIFNFRGIMAYISHDLDDPKLLDKLYQSYNVTKQKFNGVLNNLEHRYYAKVQYDDLTIEAFIGHITWDEACDRFIALLQSDPDLQITTGEPNMRMVYLNNLFQSHFFLLNKASMNLKEKKELLMEGMKHFLELLSRYSHSQNPFEKGKILATIATNSELLQYLDSAERRDLLFKLIVLEQPVTYVHCLMVAELSKILTTGMVTEQPEYFVGMPGMNTVDDVKKNKEYIISFVYESAVFHDLGKISMPSIVNNCFRKLTENEYNIIKLHPEKARPFFDIDPSISPYLDVALGHHKWYDGDGYPISFNNRKSPYFPAINIVTLCDCMDAATENIGRNYHRPKSFETVMGEFDAEAGTRYDPKLSSFIYSHQDIYDQMKQTVNTGRYDNYYKMYMSYLRQ